MRTNRQTAGSVNCDASVIAMMNRQILDVSAIRAVGFRVCQIADVVEVDRVATQVGLLSHMFYFESL